MRTTVTNEIGIPGSAIEEVFPFHVAIDEQLQVVQVGTAMARIAPELAVGTALDASLVLRRPHGQLTIQTISNSYDQPFLLELRESGVRLRGQFLRVPDGVWFYLGSPWFDSAAEIEAAGLSLADYPAHDPMAELLMIGQTQQIALNDLHEVNERLNQQREAVKRTERIYRDAIAAADAVAYHANTGSDRFEFIDAEISRLTGHDANEMTPSLLQSFFVDTKELGNRGNDAASGRPATCRSEHRIRAKDGSERWLSDASIEVLDRNGRATGVVGILEDITERKYKEAERERLSVELDTILRLSPQGFAAFDERGLLSYCNPSFEEMTGIPRTRLKGVQLNELDDIFAALSDDEPVFTSFVDLAEDDSDEITITRPRRRTFTRSLRLMHSATDTHSGWVLFMRDVTREREIDRMKSEFLSIAAHELRTPMTSVRGFAELLLSNEYDQAMTREIAETIHRQSTLLVHIVNGLLDIARIEAGKGEDFVYERHSLHDLVQQTIDSLHIPGDSREVKVALTPENAPIILADAKKMIQAMTNVLSNAYKYSPDGGEIALTIMRHTRNGRAEVAIQVSDAGIGMDETEVGRLFERFYRADPSGAIPGTGLGMSLVREIVELHNGTIEIDSTKGLGTTVTVNLPEATQPNNLATAGAAR